MLGAVLTGGASTRMGSDKALLQVDGVPMARRVADALLGAGCDAVCCVGGDTRGLRLIGLSVVHDAFPGEGPMGGVVTALRQADLRRAPVLVLAACDLPDLDAAAVRQVVDALFADVDGDVALAETTRRWAFDPSVGQCVATAVDGENRTAMVMACRVADAGPIAEIAWADGERSVRGFLLRARAVAVPILRGAALADADQPGDLRGR